MDRRHTLAALPALAAAAAASAPGLADDDPAARIAEAFVYGFAVHDLARTRWNATQNPANPRRATVNAPNHVRRLLDHRARAVTAPNNDTLYTSAWLDLSGGPLTVRVPAMGRRYWSLAFMDPFTDNVACVSRRTSGGDARTLWIAPPGWTGSPPAGATPLRMPANDLWLLGRVLVEVGDAAVVELDDALGHLGDRGEVGEDDRQVVLDRRGHPEDVVVVAAAGRDADPCGLAASEAAAAFDGRLVGLRDPLAGPDQQAGRCSGSGAHGQAAEPVGHLRLARTVAPRQPRRDAAPVDDRVELVEVDGSCGGHGSDVGGAAPESAWRPRPDSNRRPSARQAGALAN